MTYYGVPGEEAAARCRREGWGPGTLLAGDEGYGETVIRITAVGEDRILARAIAHEGELIDRSESMWTLDFRPWRRVPSISDLSQEMTPSAEAADAR